MSQGSTWGLALVLAAGCVRIDTAPNGIASARLGSAQLGAVPPSIVVGDVLRDVNGDSTVLTAQAFDEAGREVATAPVRFVYVPSARDTLNRPVPDTALIVDSLTGAVRARSPFRLSQALVAVRIGDRLQLIDTLAIVPAPDSARADAAVTDPLRYCVDTTRAISQRPDTAVVNRIDTLYLYNTLGPFRVLVRGDSAGTRVPIRRRLVRWTIDSAPSLPPVPLPGGPTTTTVPVFGVIANSNNSDRIVTADTTDASGLSAVRLRIRPVALGTVPASFTVQLVATPQPGTVAVRGSPIRFTVRIQRSPNVTCR